MRIVNLSPDESVDLLSVTLDETPETIRAMTTTERTAEWNMHRRIVWEWYLWRFTNDVNGGGYDHAALCMIARSVCVNVDGVEPFVYNRAKCEANAGLTDFPSSEDVDPQWWGSTCFYNEATAPVTRRLVRQDLTDTEHDVPTSDDDNTRGYMYRWQTALEWLHEHGHLSTDLP